MVQMCATIRGDHSAFVSLENCLVCLHCNRDRALSNLGLKCLRVRRLNFYIRACGHLSQLLDGFAAGCVAHPAVVRVVFVRFEWVLLRPFKGPVHHPTEATQIAIVGAADKLLS